MLEDIREKVERAGDKVGRGDAATAEIEEIRAKKAELDGLDTELRKEFAATEKKLKDANLPREILDRHYKFVKHYNDNLAELKANLSAIEKPSAKSHELRAALKKAKAHLEKTKPPKKHVPLDPNNLPFRSLKAKSPREPRLKKEEFEKDFPPQRPQSSPRTAESILDAGERRLTRISDSKSGNSVHDFAANEREWARINSAANGTTDEHGWIPGVNSERRTHNSELLSAPSPLTPDPSRIRLAYNDIASDVPFQLPLPSGERTEVRGGSSLAPSPILPVTAFSVLSEYSVANDLTPNSELSTLNLAAATAADLPTAADLSQTPEVQFTDDIKALAAELEYKPVKIYEYVRNNIEFVPTYGSIQGADMCLQTKQCNDFDTASLLIALLRVSGIAARYVYGTIEVPIDKVMNWVGGVTNPNMAGTVFATNGVPVRNVISGGIIKAVQIEHVWVKAFVDYIPSRGAVHKQGDTWIPLDPSYKQYNYTQGLDIQTAVPFDAQTFIDQIKATATINEAEGYVTNVNSLLIQQTMQDYQTRVQNYIQQNHPNTTVGDVIGKKEIVKQEYPFLLGTLPYKTIVVGSEFAQVPANLRATMSFSIPDPTGLSAGLSYSTSLPQIAGKKITLSFSPATANDQKVIESYLPKPHPDGTPIQPRELPSSLPAYLINLKPELRIEGLVVATGASSMMGKEQSFTMSLNEPGFGINNINNIVQAGEYYGIGLDTGKIGNLDALKAKLEATKAKLAAQQYEGLSKDDLVGDLLYTTMASYFTELDMNDEITAKVMNVVRYRAPSLGMFSLGLNVQNVFGIPMRANPRGFMMDVDRIMQAVFSKDGSLDKVKQFMTISGSTSSMLEFFIPEQLYSQPSNPVTGISATKALKLANDQGIPIYKIDNSNIAAILPLLQVGDEVKTDILNAVNAGKQITVSKSNITYSGWRGCGYIIVDPNTGAGAYMISGALSGGAVLGATMQMLAAFLIPLTATTSSPLAAPPQSSCLQICMSDLATGVLQDYTTCLTNVAIGSVVVGVVVPSIIVLFEPYLLPALIPAIILTTASTLFISVGLCNIRAGVLLMSGALGCLVGCGGY